MRSRSSAIRDAIYLVTAFPVGLFGGLFFRYALAAFLSWKGVIGPLGDLTMDDRNFLQIAMYVTVIGISVTYYDVFMGIEGLLSKWWPGHFKGPEQN